MTKPWSQSLFFLFLFFFCDFSPSKIQSHDHPFKGLPVITQVDWVENSLTEHWLWLTLFNLWGWWSNDLLMKIEINHRSWFVDWWPLRAVFISEVDSWSQLEWMDALFSSLLFLFLCDGVSWHRLPSCLSHSSIVHTCLMPCVSGLSFNTHQR